MSSSYTQNAKEKLAEEIQQLKKKKDLVRVVNIIIEDSVIQEKLNNPEDNPFTENSNGMFMFFHILKTTTYKKLEKLLSKIKNERKEQKDSNTASSEKRDYRPYFHDEFPSERHMSPRLRYSNREKNLMKRKKYDQEINSSEKYCTFDVSMLTEEGSEMEAKSPKTPRTPPSPPKTKSRRKKKNPLKN